MNLLELHKKENLTENIKLCKVYIQLEELLKELNKKKLSPQVVEHINLEIKELNTSSLTDSRLLKFAKEKRTKIIRLLEKEHKIVPKNYYRNLWLVLGMSAFGLPLGVVFGLMTSNMGLLAIGLPIGMAIGIAVGTKMDNKAQEEGRQLQIEISY
ncbi:hypothetical protein [Aequorivita viscosa]|uniref:Uncharacterized protein n=1 Tax=Aequorivita viscosa TaxID=797419 RepID=A0A1M6F5M6_9FLAO|nr:hypothetical protein [Aequorivita viscosa]SDW65176.1 hypothetical protein SAMN05216556_10852 [Aequorivita viscosa]SHI92981.1 hypothetical protein SAMN04487908_10751 [Aequorivita viscosa]